jgi:hypothetical protein
MAGRKQGVLRPGALWRVIGVAGMERRGVFQVSPGMVNARSGMSNRGRYDKYP